MISMQFGQAYPPTSFRPGNALGRAYRRNSLRQIDGLFQDHLALINRALQVHLTGVLAQIKRLLDERNHTVLDDDIDIGASRNNIVKHTDGRDDKGLSTTRDQSSLARGVSW